MGSSEVRIQGADRLELAENNRTEARGNSQCGLYRSPRGGLREPSVPRRTEASSLRQPPHEHVPVSSDGQDDVALTGEGDDGHSQILTGRKQVLMRGHHLDMMSSRCQGRYSTKFSFPCSRHLPFEALAGIVTLRKLREKFRTLWKCDP